MIDAKWCAEWITSECARRGIRLNKFYDESGVGRATVSRWRTEKGVPSEFTIARINEYFGVDLEEIYAGKQRTRCDVETASGEDMSRSEIIDLLSNLRDSERVLLEVTRDMTSEQVLKIADFVKSLKQQN